MHWLKTTKQVGKMSRRRKGRARRRGEEEEEEKKQQQPLLPLSSKKGQDPRSQHMVPPLKSPTPSGRATVCSLQVSVGGVHAL